MEAQCRGAGRTAHQRTRREEKHIHKTMMLVRPDDTPLIGRTIIRPRGQSIKMEKRKGGRRDAVRFGESQRHGNKYVREFSKCEKSISITTVSVNQRYSSCSSSRPQSL
ncbi:uncharacterized protein LOC113205953 isoform X1 [Frankliniella occidentalis]|uniref:Uncharacterized protein LOC113205953 isoform X1 n=1 Tax=Frankliniella occidentalis TaxID=133901 RepID=A0A9C6U0T5_FRAOC|nr:uncharacterized protein LOC113205953 isoform X1 [Frankliniella occidentalis]